MPCSIMQGSCWGVVRGVAKVFPFISRTLLEEDYRKVLEARLKGSLPVSTTGYVLLSVAVFIRVYVCTYVQVGSV